MGTKRSELELRKTFKRKVKMIKDLLERANKEELLSEERMEHAALIAVELRTLFCYSGGEPLIRTANMEKELIFPLYERLGLDNELSEFMLVETNSASDDKYTFRYSCPRDRFKMLHTWMTYKSWINQVVVDLKHPKYPPLSRADIIKTIADKTGAHYDMDSDKYLEPMNPQNNMMLIIAIGGENRQCDVDCNNLLSENILAIADEVIFSYKYFYRPILQQRKHDTGCVQRAYEYTDGDRKKYKYTASVPDVVKYSANRIYPCRVAELPIHAYDLIFRGKSYFVELIRLEDFLN